MIDVTTLKAELQKYGQEHLLQYWDSLTPEEQHELYHDISE